MFKKTLLMLALLGATASANASYTTEAQNQTYQGAAGAKSTESGVDSFQFEKFDSALGVLTGVNINYSFFIDSGYIGANNLSNQYVTGNAELGSNLAFDFSALSSYVSISSSSITNKQEFYLQPSGTENITTGSDPDKFRLDGSYGEDSVSKMFTESFILDIFTGDGGFNVDFLTNSITQITANGAGVHGLFEAVDIGLSMSVSYVYDDFPEPEDNASAVPVPLVGAAGLAMFGLASFRRKDK